MRRSMIDQLQRLKVTLAVVGVMWTVLALSYVLPLRQYGIYPRTLQGLPGIFTSPFLHVNVQHLVANTPMLIVLGWLMQNLDRKRPGFTVIGIGFLAGLGTWLIGGSHENHIGASGVIYGLLGYTMALGFFNRRPVTILVSLAMAALYGGAIWGILPGQGPVSWEGHLSGFVGGMIMAKASVAR